MADNRLNIWPIGDILRTDAAFDRVSVAERLDRYNLQKEASVFRAVQQICNALPRAQQIWLAICLFCIAIAQVDQPYPSVAPLHHVPTLILVLLAPVMLRRWPISNQALICLILFFLLHTLGGRYTYTNTPYDLWTHYLFGLELTELFDWQRNHYDRLVHFGFGVLMVYPVKEILTRYARVSSGLAIYIALEFVMGISAVYEVVEWLLSIVLAGDAADSYNGQQGDIWDAQKDMALAFLGALITSSWLILRRRMRKG
jgi:putative membrane protein